MASNNKIGLIIRHEYLMRVRKKSFWLVGILTPIAIVAVGALIGFLSVANKKDTTTLAVYDLSGRMAGQIAGEDNLRLLPLDVSAVPLDSAKVMALKDENVKGVLVIPADTTRSYAGIERGMTMYYNENVPLSVQNAVTRQVKRIIEEKKLELLGIDSKALDEAKADVSIRMVDVSRDADRSDGDMVQGFKLALAFILCIMLYMFMVFSGNMVMTSTLEEKTNRIVEVLISSVRPFELMMGKIISSGLVCITQLAVWVIMLSTLSIAGAAGISAFTAAQDDRAMAEMTATASPEMARTMETIDLASSAQTDEFAEILGQLSQVDFLSIGIVSLVFFILGYLLYASLYAAVGAAVDSAGDAGQFVMPITIPLLVAFYVALMIVDNPNGPVAFWMSMIPLTSPVVMMVRVPFGVPVWEIVLSAVLLLGTFLALTWVAAKIYRIGLLSYGSKPSYKELWKWIRAGH